MRVAVITEEDLFYVREFFVEFFRLHNPSDYDIRGITILPAFNKKSTLELARQMYGFYGPVNFLRMGSWYAWRKISGKTIRSLSEKYTVPVVDTEDVNSSKYLSWLRKENVDVVVSVAAPVIFRSALLNTPPKGCINSHSALLPENRGMMPVFWALYKNSPELGVTIHTMDEELDRGRILLQEKVPVSRESLHEMIMKTKRISARLMDQVLKRMAREDLRGELIAEGGSYQSFPTPHQVREFKKSGKRLI
ncbi:MAG: formyltransferase family protein [Fibrobacterota bacterium]